VLVWLQALRAPITDIWKLRSSDQRLYLQTAAAPAGCCVVLGGLKVGRKKLFLHRVRATAPLQHRQLLQLALRALCLWSASVQTLTWYVSLNGAEAWCCLHGQSAWFAGVGNLTASAAVPGGHAINMQGLRSVQAAPGCAGPDWAELC